MYIYNEHVLILHRDKIKKLRVYYHITTNTKTTVSSQTKSVAGGREDNPETVSSEFGDPSGLPRRQRGSSRTALKLSSLSKHGQMMVSQTTIGNVESKEGEGWEERK